MIKNKLKIHGILDFILYFVLLTTPFNFKIVVTIVMAIFATIDYKKNKSTFKNFAYNSLFFQSFIICILVSFFSALETLPKPFDMYLTSVLFIVIILAFILAYRKGYIDISSRYGSTNINVNGVMYTRKFRRTNSKNSWTCTKQSFPNTVRRRVNADGKSTKINFDITSELGTINVLIKDKNRVILDSKRLSNAIFDVEVTGPVTVKFYRLEKFVGSFSVKW